MGNTPELSAARLNVLASPLFPVSRTDGSVHRLTLPAILAGLLTEASPISGFLGQTVEQRSHWHRFMVRCAAKALRSLGLGTHAVSHMPTDQLAAHISSALADASGTHSAWDLVPDDPLHPGFLQTPVTGGKTPAEAGYKQRAIAELTALIGSKEFERKSQSARYLLAHEVVYGLIEYQSGVIFGGRGNYETTLTPSRSGKGSGVPFMALEFDDAPGLTFQWGVQTLLDDWDYIRDECGLKGETWAIWAEPWDGADSLPASRLDPAFIPYARMIRLSTPDSSGRFEHFLFRASKTSRVTDHTEGAVFGDPFTPLFPNPKHDDQFKVRGVMDRGFDYSEVVELLGFGTRGRPSRSVQAFYQDAESLSRSAVSVHFEGVAFEQGKTLGFHRRRIPLPVDKLGALSFAEPDPFRKVHTDMLERLSDVKRILRSAARIALHGEPRPKKGDDALVALASTPLDDWADHGGRYVAFFFEAARQEADGSSDWIILWVEQLCAQGREAFDAILPGLPTPGAQRMARQASALNYLDMKLRRYLRQNRGAETNEPATTEAAG